MLSELRAPTLCEAGVQDCTTAGSTIHMDEQVVLHPGMVFFCRWLWPVETSPYTYAV